MAYHVSILRTRHGHRSPITRSEAEALSASHPACRIGKSHLGECEFVYVAGGEVKLRLILQDGELWTANPGPSELKLMIAIASQLDARVRGDEFETFLRQQRARRHAIFYALRHRRRTSPIPCG